MTSLSLNKCNINSKVSLRVFSYFSYDKLQKIKQLRCLAHRWFFHIKKLMFVHWECRNKSIYPSKNVCYLNTYQSSYDSLTKMLVISNKYPETTPLSFKTLFHIINSFEDISASSLKWFILYIRSYHVSNASFF